MTGATENIYVGLYEFGDMMLVLQFLRPGDLFLDIGANVGSFSVLASGVCKADSWAFEPDPTAVERLRRNIEVNCLSDRVKVMPMALGPSEGIVDFTVGQDSINRVAAEADKIILQVSQRTLDSLIGDAKPAMIKMDVEGYEEQVLLGASATLAKPELKIVESEGSTPGILDLLRRNGFVQMSYDPFSRRLQPIDACSRGSNACNAVFVCDPQFVAAQLVAASPVHMLGQSI